MSADAALSIHGGLLSDQVGKFRCYRKIGNSVNYDGEWLARHARVSLPVSKAWILVSDSKLIDARLLNEYEAGALNVVEAYHRQKSSAKIELPDSVMIPPNCSKFMRHR